MPKELQVISFYNKEVSSYPKYIRLFPINHFVAYVIPGVCIASLIALFILSFCSLQSTVILESITT